MNLLSTLTDNRRYVNEICSNFSHLLTTASNISMYMVEAFTKDYVSAPISRMDRADLCKAIKKDSLTNHCQ